MPDYIPAPNADFQVWGTNFSDVCGDNAAALGLTAANVTEITNAASNFATKLSASEAAKAAAHGAVATTKAQRTSSTATFRKFARLFMANPNIDKNLLGQLGLPTTPGTLGPVTNPINLSATGFSNGQNKLKWGRNGNSSNTTFNIEARIGDSNTWTWVGSTTKTKWTHEGQTPGTQVTYRVFAQRAEVRSGYSNEAVVYSQSEADFMYLSEAA